MRSTDEVALLAEAMLVFRRVRHEEFPAEMFGEAGWDVLLALFVADARGHRLTAAEVCRRSGLAPATTSRWLMYLTERRLIVGDGDGDLNDPLTLSAEGLKRMEDVLAKARTLRTALMDGDPLDRPRD